MTHFQPHPVPAYPARRSLPSLHVSGEEKLCLEEVSLPKQMVLVKAYVRTIVKDKPGPKKVKESRDKTGCGEFM